MADYVQPAYEDPVDRMVKQGLIPENVDLSDPKIDDLLERARILSLFDSHLGRPAGFVLPLQPSTAQAKPGWLSELWRTRRGHLFLIPGDSPLGFRLPLQSLPDVAPDHEPSGGGVPVRTALTVEAREGRLCVFMPPLESLTDYLELLAVVE
jgi:uncharacterized protein (DUF2126 family)